MKCYDNGGIDGSVVVDEVSQKSANIGYNANTGEYGDMLKDGVIDPAKVVRTALQNGSSVARILLSTDCLITEKPKKESDDGGAEGGMDDMGGMM